MIKNAQVITNDHRILVECVNHLCLEINKVTKELREIKKEVKALKPVVEEVKPVETNITSKKGK